MKKVRIVVIGIAGRMGRALAAAINESQAAELVGGVEKSGSPFIGLDVGAVGGIEPRGVNVTDRLADIIDSSDALIDFSSPAASIENFLLAIERSRAIVIGTTGFSSEQRKTFETMASSGRALIAPNMSVGVNALFRLARMAAKILPDYDAEVIEMHHGGKVDAPSGTALRLAETVAQARSSDLSSVARYDRRGRIGARPKGEIGLMTLRGGDVVGDHTLILAGSGERLELTHRASSRANFATGALRAALWLIDQPNGLYDMSSTID